MPQHHLQNRRGASLLAFFLPAWYSFFSAIIFYRARQTISQHTQENFQVCLAYLSILHNRWHFKHRALKEALGRSQRLFTSARWSHLRSPLLYRLWISWFFAWLTYNEVLMEFHPPRVAPAISKLYFYLLHYGVPLYLVYTLPFLRMPIPVERYTKRRSFSNRPWVHRAVEVRQIVVIRFAAEIAAASNVAPPHLKCPITWFFLFQKFWRIFQCRIGAR